MSYYGASAQERMMKVQEVILRATAKKITWWQAAEIVGLSDRQMRRWKQRYDEWGMTGFMTVGEGGRVRSGFRLRPWRKC